MLNRLRAWKFFQKPAKNQMTREQRVAMYESLLRAGVRDVLWRYHGDWLGAKAHVMNFIHQSKNQNHQIAWLALNRVIHKEMEECPTQYGNRRLACGS